MKKCEYCGKEYDPEYEEDTFACECSYLDYRNFRRNLCAECALQAIEDDDDGVYIERCEKCGCEFDLVLEKSKFSSHFPWYNGTVLTDHWSNHIQCADCAICEIEASDGEGVEDDADNEAISVYDAAQIWASHGKDEDYMFGYSEDELENAL